MEWRPIETQPLDGSQVLFWSPNGGCSIAPSLPAAEPTREQQVKLYRDMGDWPHVGWNPTHWMPLPAPPEEGL